MAVQIDHHADMLGDVERISAFRKAIHETVRPGDVVVDVGAGLGLLASSALDAQAGHVTAIEYVPQLAALAAEILSDTPIQVLTGRSYDIHLSPPPDVIVTETIGPVGPEENIVEIAYDLKCRYPNLQRMIPRRMKLHAQALFSSSVSADREMVLENINSSSMGNFDPDRARAALDRAYCEQVYQGDLSEAEPKSERLDLADYLLGVSESSDFSVVLSLPITNDWNAVAISFEAELSESTTLSNNYLGVKTHWLNSYVARLSESSVLQVAYDSHTTSFIIHWL